MLQFKARKSLKCSRIVGIKDFNFHEAYALTRVLAAACCAIIMTNCDEARKKTYV